MSEVPLYAVVDDRNQQFRAAVGQRVRIALRSDLEPGSTVTFDKVCAVTADPATGQPGAVGSPYVDGATVTGCVVGNVRGQKLYIQKFKRRKNMRRRTGFRAHYTEIRVDGIHVGGTRGGDA